MYYRYAAAIGTLLVSLFPITMAVHNYEGVFHLTKVLNAKNEEVLVPEGDFKVRMQPGQQANQYDMNIKVGNSMGASATVSGSDDDVKDAVAIGGVRSTMMMPPKEIFEVEMALSDILPSARLIYLAENNSLLVIEGSKGTIKCTRSL